MSRRASMALVVAVPSVSLAPATLMRTERTGDASSANLESLSRVGEIAARQAAAVHLEGCTNGDVVASGSASTP